MSLVGTILTNLDGTRIDRFGSCMRLCPRIGRNESCLLILARQQVVQPSSQPSSAWVRLLATWPCQYWVPSEIRVCQHLLQLKLMITAVLVMFNDVCMTCLKDMMQNDSQPAFVSRVTSTCRHVGVFKHVQIHFATSACFHGLVRASPQEYAAFTSC